MPLESLRPALTLEMLPGDVLVVISDGIYEYENATGEQFGEARAQALIAASRGKTASQMLDALMAEVRTFADGAPQEDDMTAVLVKRREAGGMCGTFARTFDSLPAMTAFTAEGFARMGIDPRLLPTVDLAVEELFTNMVKYGVGSTAPVRVELDAIAGGVELRLIDDDVEPFDITRSPDVDIHAPIEEREPGGLGLHLIRRMADSIDYEYVKERRQSRLTLRFTGAGSAARR
jgi:anti-sigma regulatory factor (Ser/Thr protein kinase)